MNIITRILAKASSISDLLSEYLALAGGIIIVGLMLMISVSAISRYFFHHALASVIQFSSYTLLFIAFLGAPLLARKNAHISVDILPSVLGKKAKVALEIFSCTLSFLICIILAWYGIKSTYQAYIQHEVIVNILRTPKYQLLLIIALGFFLTSINFLVNVLKHFKRTKNLN